jgi:hypothetical protein
MRTGENGVSRRSMLAAAAGGGVLTAMTTLSQAQTGAPVPEPLRSGRGGSNPGPKNSARMQQNPDVILPPATDHGTLPNLRFSFDDSHVRLESVRKHQARLQSFRSMRRIEARRKKASALRLRFSQSLASLRQRLSQAMVRSTIQRLGSTANPLT